MRIAIVTNAVDKGGGQDRVNYEVAKRACEMGHDILLVASDANQKLASKPCITWAQTSVDHWPTRLLKDQAFAWRSTQWLRSNHSEIDVTLANGCNTWFPAEVNAVHFVHSAWKESPVHTSRVRNGPYGWYHWLYSTINAKWEKHTLAKANTVVAVSARVRDELTKIGISPDSIRVIPNGVNPEEFKPGPADRSTLELPENVPLALFVGEIRTPRKNLETILEALPQVPDLHLAVVGTRNSSQYPRMADRLNVADRVHFLGYRQDIPDLMRAADLFVFPSRYEACSLVLLEAMASGLPIVTAQTAGGAELVGDDVGFVLPDPNDDEKLASAVNALIRNPEKIKRMSRRARSTALQHTWSKMVNEYLQVFENECT